MTGAPQALRIGVAGLGRAFTLMLPTFVADPRVRLVAGADGRASAREQFAATTGARAYGDVASLVADAGVDAVYIATPHGLHAEHAIQAARAGKHVLVEKPMAMTLAEADAMIAAARDARVALVVGHSHSFDAPVLRARELIDAGAIGRVRMIAAQYYTDFVYRLRRPEELAPEGGGAIWSQAAHQVDIVRLLAGARATTVRAYAGAFDRERPLEGAYGALLGFDGGAFASLVYSGHAHFDSDAWCDGLDEQGRRKTVRHGAARARLAAVGAGREEDAKSARSDAAIAPDTGGGAPGERVGHEHFGVVVVSGEHGDLRLTPRGCVVYGDRDVREENVPVHPVPRVEVVDELLAAIASGKPTLHDGPWARATLAVCVAMRESARTGMEVAL